MEAGTITVMPPELRNRMVNGTVTNKEPTTGGDTVPTFRVTQEDWDTAMAELTSQLQADLTVQAETPDGLPIGDPVYPSTMAAETVTTDLPADNVIGQPVADQAHRGSLGGSVLTASATENRQGREPAAAGRRAGWHDDRRRQHQDRTR